MKPSESTRRRRLWGQFFVGLVYFSLLAAIVSEITEHPYVFVWFGLLAAVAICAGLALTWATLWALRDDGRLGQFGIGSLLFLTVFAAMFFGLVRWLDDAIERTAPTLHDQGLQFSVVAVGVLLMLLMSIPYAIGLTESVIWLAVWVLRHPMVRRLFGRQ
ncbi:MAG TPA: hypothetical protein VE890_08560 [Thermoguttaceae bacterium]|nr:hypothetical protein [Thermoguttaceae bacterium]